MFRLPVPGVPVREERVMCLIVGVPMQGRHGACPHNHR